MSRRQNPERAAVRIARKLVSEIRRRRLRPGTPLAAEHRMVEALGVARATVCEALRFLELQGALRIKAGPGGVLASMTQYSALGATVVDRW